jgi:Fe-S cluster biosynthesis and repair protein YggX
MPRMVFCRKYQQEMEALDIPPYPGAKGQDIFNHVSKKAWQEWMAHQTLLINEKRLNMMDMGTKVYLSEQMNKFLSGENVDQAEGYVPPANN